MKPEVAPELRDLFERVETAYQRYYVRQLRDRLEQAAFGKYMAFHVDTGEYLVADSQDEVLAQFRARFPGRPRLHTPHRQSAVGRVTPAMNGRLDEDCLPVLDLQLTTTSSRMMALIDTGFDGELLVHHDQLRAAGISVVFDRAEQVRLADGSEVTLLGTALAIEWHGEPRRVKVDVVPTSAPPGARALIGCQLLGDSTLFVDFPAGTVRISRPPAAGG